MAGPFAFQICKKEERVLFAVHSYFAQLQPVSGRAPFDPELLSRRAEKSHVAGFHRLLQRFFVHVAEHENLPRREILHDRRKHRTGFCCLQRLCEVQLERGTFFEFVHKANMLRRILLSIQILVVILPAGQNPNHVSSLFLKRHSSFRGEVNLPGSKSIANRALLLASLARGTTRLTGLPDADDVVVFQKNLPALGIQARSAGEGLEITGAGGAFPVSGATLNVDNAGTAMRPLAAALCAGNGRFVLDGNEQMRRRPIGDLVRGLAALGIEIHGTDAVIQGRPEIVPPLTIHAKGIAGGRTNLSGNVSSQFISALLLAAPLAKGEITLEVPGDPVSKPYIDMTIAMMKQFGVDVSRERYSLFRVQPASYVSPGSYRIEGDATAASYFLSLGALSGPVTVRTIFADSMQGDVRFADVLSQMGAHVERNADSITVRRGTLRGLDIDMNDMPDAAMTLAVLALFCEGPTFIRNIANLRVKESERIAGLASELRKLGAQVEEGPDSLRVTPPAQLRSAEIETFRDHRMAMAFSLAAFGTDVTILDPGCVSKTYPSYFEDFKTVLA